MQRLAVTLFASVAVLGAAPGAPNVSGEKGSCYSIRPLPALASGTRVFVRPTLAVSTKRSSTMPAGLPPAALSDENTVIVGATVEGNVHTGLYTVTGGFNGSDNAPTVIAPGKNGHQAVISAVAIICAFPPGAELPSWTNNTAPDIVIP